jgi:glutamate formiminotransferase
MRLLSVPNWSFDKQHPAYQDMQTILGRFPLETHYLQSDPDHNRTVLAFSASHEIVFEVLRELCMVLLPQIDLTQHKGIHPRIGALDVCPFILYPEDDFREASLWVEEWARWLSKTFDLPVFLYEKSAKQGPAELPLLRGKGFEQLLNKPLRPDLGPSALHSKLGATITGIRDFLIAMNINLATQDLAFAKKLAAEIRALRDQGDPRFAGVRALGFDLTSRGMVQVSLNLIQPDQTSPDFFVEWVSEKCAQARVVVEGTELIGVIRRKDLPKATLLEIRRAQVVF